jgi:hypothetical protein
VTAPNKETEFQFALTMLATCQERLRAASGALTDGNPTTALGYLQEAQKSLTALLVTSGRLVGRSQGKWPE